MQKYEISINRCKNINTFYSYFYKCFRAIKTRRISIKKDTQ